MYYGKIRDCDIANGKGVRVSLFVSGCRNHCKNCFFFWQRQVVAVHTAGEGVLGLYKEFVEHGCHLGYDIAAVVVACQQGCEVVLIEIAYLFPEFLENPLRLGRGHIDAYLPAIDLLVIHNLDEGSAMKVIDEVFLVEVHHGKSHRINRPVGVHAAD